MKKMMKKKEKRIGVKEFFRPTTGKIIIFIIIFLLLPVPYTAIILGGPEECGGAETCTLGYEMKWAALLGGIFLIASFFVGGNQPFLSLSDYLWKVPYLIIISYLTSCLIIFIYQKNNGPPTPKGVGL
ncbi:MAG: hypothetical protein Q8N99_00405 [Nanoarchaeota archaeon]|nr:hypothetical protein [Nanoarchaeota archaeon]